MNAYLVTAAAKFGHDVAGKKLGVAAGHIDVDIAHAQQAVQNFLKPGHELHFIEQKIIRPVAAHGIRDIAEAYLGVAQLLVLDAVQSNLDNMILRNAAFKQIPLEYGEQQIGFSAAPYAGDDLDHAVVPALDQLVQICLSSDLHAITPIFCAIHVF